MQTFLPYADFKRFAECLDNKRLFKQVIEAYSIYRTNTNQVKGYKNHPIVLMWRGYDRALLEYAVICGEVWRKRGYKTTFIDTKLKTEYDKIREQEIILPNWFGRMDIHDSHKSNLLRKNKEYYSKYFNIQDNLPYIWA
jgi:hypothetical protein